MRSPLLATALGCALVLSADVAVVAARSGDDRRPTAAREVASAPGATPSPAPPPAPPKPKPKPKPPPRVLLTVTAGQAKPRVLSTTASGTGARPEGRPAAPSHAVSSRAKLVATAEVLDSNEFYGCGVAGCSTTRFTESGIVVRDLAGKRRRVLTKGGYDTQPSFSPDGSAIAYLAHTRRKDGSETDVVAVMSAAGGHLTSFVAPGTGTYSAAVWSPKGNTIAAVERRAVGGKAHVRVVLIDVDTGKRKALADGEFDQVRWAPSGAFLVARGAVQAWRASYSMRLTTGYDLWVVPVNGRGARRITHQAPARHAADSKSAYYCGTSVGEIGVTEPFVSPDSKLVAFATNQPHRHRAGRGYDVQVVRADGTGLRTVYRAPAPRCSGSEVRATVATPVGWIG